MARAREQGVPLTGPEGLLKQLTKTVLETALNQEMTGQLGHDKHGQPVAASVTRTSSSVPHGCQEISLVVVHGLG